ncbi:glycosyltransferase family 2 protein [Breoghania sp. L-A4]|uniref:glycosyltransferase family 2 protein n=1 Tax=Breoghania sp. L-A4 TaxID=2304600 RepID=UPI000E3607D0|nr:glycosyltransferase family 2 protein [Breoghania sp. L-A4]AXS41234.1 glycosyltransferase family 2 protein [Breoghania sp. L-A4]
MSDNTPLFAILLPVHRPPNMLRIAVESVLAQIESSFELLIVCDGAPRETVACANAFAARDKRVKVFDFDKGERHGEAHRHAALADTTARFVAHIGDDDIWFPDHLTELSALLDDVDFGNLLQAELLTDGTIEVHVGDLSEPQTRDHMLLDTWNFFGPSVAGYRMAAYRKLARGWSPAPEDLWSDLHMWRKFLERDDLTFGTRFSVQGIKFPAHGRETMGVGEREAENARAVQMFTAPKRRRDFQARAFQALFHARQTILNDQLNRVATALDGINASLAPLKPAQGLQTPTPGGCAHQSQLPPGSIANTIVKVQSSADSLTEGVDALRANAEAAWRELDTIKSSPLWTLSWPLRRLENFLKNR